jgi:putative ABC transport system permease protein
VLGLLGGAFALLVGAWALPTLTALAPPELPRIHGVSLGMDTALVVLALSVAAGLALAAYPVVVHVGRAPAPALVGGPRAGGAGPGRQRFRSGLVVIQMALALTLAVGAGLLIRTIQNLHDVDLGFRPEGVLAVDLVLSPEGYGDEASFWAVYREVRARVRALPGVTSAGMAESLPVAGGFGCTTQGFEDRTVYERVREAGVTACAGQVRVSPGFFETLAIPVLAGRSFTDADLDPDARTVIVSRAFAERFWPGADPLGQGVAPEGRADGPFHRVIGVVGDVPAASNDDQHPLSQTAIAVYYPSPGAMTLVARTDAADPLSLLPAIRLVVAEIEPELPLSNPTDMESVVESALVRISFVSLLLGIAAATALFLSAVGVFGVTAWVVARRTREIGVRMAIGARPADVERAVVGRALALAGVGLVLGGGLALATSRVLGALLVGVEPTDALVFGAAAGSLAVVTLAAAWIPARRAARVQPVEALGSE